MKCFLKVLYMRRASSFQASRSDVGSRYQNVLANTWTRRSPPFQPMARTSPLPALESYAGIHAALTEAIGDGVLDPHVTGRDRYPERPFDAEADGDMASCHRASMGLGQ